ncbi:pyridoxamine 5'-phosphate oxidase family protein [Streptomyces sulphureus]|uniref:pyridoxamine 5'-phosphate oxidase family protein n=1 Tax=Streptomyces sulphureus TaxID=47758 RepID=UPI0003721479|nr:pyridoxamine 5'-phosphate oxidase family protein [Streptomyces sulphureus]
MALPREERERFLAEPHIGALSVDSGSEGRGPLSVPVWYQYQPGANLWVLTGRDSRKAELVAAAGRFTMLVERIQPSVRYVSVEGPVVGTVPATKDDLREVAARYLPADKVAPYVDEAWTAHGEQVVIHMHPEHWLSSDLGSF